MILKRRSYWTKKKGTRTNYVKYIYYKIILFNQFSPNYYIYI